MTQGYRDLRSPRLTLLLLGLLLGPGAELAAQAVVSGFEGSVEMGVYESDYDLLAYSTAVAMEPAVQQVEGSLLSRVFEKPEGRSNLEIFRSYQRELAAEGFTIHLAAEPSNTTGWMVKQLYDPPNTVAFNDRPYRAPGSSERARGLDLPYIVGAADYYLVASRERGSEQRWVTVVLSRSRPRYLVEELTPTAMETGTVALNLDAMRSAILESGKIAIYDIHFATGSAVIQPESAEALRVVAAYLSDTSDSFYIVGHTDDTGSLQRNLMLSEERAAAVKQALVEEHGIDAGLLETRGVGPLAPVSSNNDDAGRAANRRVEIVQRLP